MENIFTVEDTDTKLLTTKSMVNKCRSLAETACVNMEDDLVQCTMTKNDDSVQKKDTVI